VTISDYLYLFSRLNHITSRCQIKKRYAIQATQWSVSLCINFHSSAPCRHHVLSSPTFSLSTIQTQRLQRVRSRHRQPHLKISRMRLFRASILSFVMTILLTFDIEATDPPHVMILIQTWTGVLVRTLGWRMHNRLLLSLVIWFRDTNFSDILHHKFHFEVQLNLNDSI
jgi:hypothetical protein